MASLLVSSFIGATVYAVGAQVGLEKIGIGRPHQCELGTNLYRLLRPLPPPTWWMFVPMAQYRIISLWTHTHQLRRG